MRGSVRTGARGAAGAGAATTGGAGGVMCTGAGGRHHLRRGDRRRRCRRRVDVDFGGRHEGRRPAARTWAAAAVLRRRRRSGFGLLDDLGLDRSLDHFDHALGQAGDQRPAQHHVQRHHDAESKQVPARVAVLLGEIHSTSPVDPAQDGRRHCKRMTTAF